MILGKILLFLVLPIPCKLTLCKLTWRCYSFKMLFATFYISCNNKFELVLTGYKSKKSKKYRNTEKKTQKSVF